MGSKKQWEIEFEKYNETETTQKIKDLESQLKPKELKDSEGNVIKDSEGNVMKDRGVSDAEAKKINKEINDLKRKQSIMTKNSTKIANIIEFKNKLEQEQAEYAKQIREYETLQKEEKAKIKIDERLDNKINEINKKLREIMVEQNRKDLSEDDKKRLNGQYASLQNEKLKNNRDYQENQKNNEKFESLHKINIDELKTENKDLKVKIGKCNFAGQMLMQGKEWDEIEVSYAKDKVYKAKGGEKITKKYGKDEKKEKIKNKEPKEENNDLKDKIMNETNKEIEKDNEKNQDPEKAVNEAQKIIAGETKVSIQPEAKVEKQEPEQKENKENYENDEKADEESALAEQGRFAKFLQKHPRLAKIINKIKDVFKMPTYEDVAEMEAKANKPEEIEKMEPENKDSEKIEQQEEPEKIEQQEEPEKIEKQESQKIEEPQEKTQRDEFLHYLHFVSEKGMDNAKEEMEKEQRHELLNQKLQKYKTEAQSKEDDGERQ